MEKAHPSVFNILLQLLDDGRLTDSKGNTVNFRNCIVIFTSNVGSSAILHVDPKNREGIREVVMDALKEKFRPEFLNRIDEFITFNALTIDQLIPIVSLEMQKVINRLLDKEIHLIMTDNAKSWLARIGYDPIYGARPLKRAIQREVETPIAKAILESKFNKGSTIIIDYNTGDSKLTLKQG
jgi:ATP-dependent Clp protease ATP-binding subunit ClpB